MRSRSFYILAIPILLLIVLRIPSLFESFWYGDEAIYAAVAEEFHKGKDLYSQTWDHKPPLIFWIFYPAAVVGWSSGFMLLRAFNLLLGVFTLVFVNEILKRNVNDLPRTVSLLFLSFFLGSTLLEGNILNAEVIFIAFNTLALLLFFVKRYFVLAGLLAFLSVITKVPGFVELALVFAGFMVVYFRQENLRFLIISIAKMAVGFIIPFVLMISYFAISGTIPDFIYANATFNQIYSLHQSNYFELFGAQLPNTYLQLFSFASIFLFTTILFWQKKISAFAYIAINLFTAEALASLLSAKNYGHYFLQVLPGLVLLIAVCLQNIKKALRINYIFYTLVLLVLFIPMLVVFRSGGTISVYAKPHEYYPWFFKGYVMNDESYKNKFWWGSGRGVERTKMFAEFIDNNYIEHSPVYVYTSKPWILALTERDLTNKYVVWFHLQYREEHLNEEMENMRKAELFVVDKDNRLLDPIKDLLEQEFELVDEFDNFEIYVNR